MTKRTKMVRTEEDWHPPFFEDSKAYVKVSLFRARPKGWWISVWGNDDFGMDKLFNDLTEAESYYRRMTLVELAKLKADGFEAS